MKNNLFFYLILLLIFCKQSANAQSGMVTYSVKSIDLVVDNNRKYADFINEMRDRAKKQEFTLEFNSQYSKFFRDESLNSDEDEKNRAITKMASIAYTSNYIHYNQKHNNFNIYVDDGNYIKAPDQKWIITSESKKIDNYLCLKATCERTFIEAKTKKPLTKIITVWFAPILPYSYGPKGYNGLPGLILELQDHKTIFLATKIKIEKNEIKISWPKNKILTEKEYRDKLGL